MANSIRIKLKTEILNHPKDRIITLPVDKNGVVTDHFWRMTIKKDNCVEILSEGIKVKTDEKKKKINKKEISKDPIEL